MEVVQEDGGVVVPEEVLVEAAQDGVEEDRVEVPGEVPIVAAVELLKEEQEHCQMWMSER